ncbi:biotin--[acetyl-CoA-carboxylase] ligase [Romboutsia sp. 13368]|uniref:biotin--[acetyl-CoA-carboxylase] ligase n=1 Tax=Romboutsia sp. 13368 TaxID=2708053 RepID=UPI0025F30DCF|nr:biotin--[acetyl-CoA-carboxylase] ligase [Romboutsia sp. 13368]
MRGKIIQTLLDNKGNFISSEALSKKLEISSEAIREHIEVLKSAGYNIEEVKKKGYKLVDDLNDLLTYNNISNKLDTKYIGRSIIHFDTIDSTNDYAKKVALQKQEGTVIISEEQTKGKGRIGRQWVSKSREGIWMSIILKPNLIPQKAPFLTLIAGASITKALNNLGVETNIKWPNDIIINNKKIAGILTELSAEIDKINYIVLGIGINVKTIDFSQEISHIATSLYKEGHKISRVDIVRNILEEFERLYLQYINHGLKNETLDICRKHSAIIGKYIYIISNGEKELVKCLDINKEGNLVIKNDENVIKEIMSGEVSIRGVEGYV